MYRKLTADRIFNGYELLPEGTVLILQKNGIVTDVVAKSEAGEDVEKYEGILSPGFINCHCHLELSHLKGKIPKHTGLINFLLKIVEQRSVDDETIQVAIQQAEAEMIQNGMLKELKERYNLEKH